MQVVRMLRDHGRQHLLSHHALRGRRREEVPSVTRSTLLQLLLVDEMAVVAKVVPIRLLEYHVTIAVTLNRRCEKRLFSPLLLSLLTIAIQSCVWRLMSNDAQTWCHSRVLLLLLVIRII